jgi:hypothetical protein
VDIPGAAPVNVSLTLDENESKVKYYFWGQDIASILRAALVHWQVSCLAIASILKKNFQTASRSSHDNFSL